MRAFTGAVAYFATAVACPLKGSAEAQASALSWALTFSTHHAEQCSVHLADFSQMFITPRGRSWRPCCLGDSLGLAFCLQPRVIGLQGVLPNLVGHSANVHLAS